MDNVLKSIDKLPFADIFTTAISGTTLENMTVPVAKGAQVNVNQKMARGGIARGPKSGYPVELHGIEAVVPLPNGREIPVQVQGSPIDYNALATAMSKVKIVIEDSYNMQSGRMD